MNLYEVIFTHYSQKDSEEGIKCYLVAENDSAVYKYVDEEYNYSGWQDREDEEGESEEDNQELYEVKDKDYNTIYSGGFKGYMLFIGGEMFDEDANFDDLYYGKTYYGWRLLSENIEENDVNQGVELGIIKTCC